MGIRDTLKKREEQREAAQNGGGNDFPEGVTRYVRMGKHGEVNADGRTFIILADPDEWYFYFVHEDKTFDGKRSIHYFRKHTCLHSPKEVVGDDILDYMKPNKKECPSCAAGARRKMYAIIPVYDIEYKTYRVIDTVEFHVNNLIADYDKIEKTMKKATKNPEYSIVGEAVHIKQVDKTFSLESGDAEDAALEEAKKFIGIDYGFEELANFREISDIVALLQEGDDEKVNKSALSAFGGVNDNKPAEEIGEVKDLTDEF
jgi:hypothetical protein